MKKSELENLINEEIDKVLAEGPFGAAKKWVKSKLGIGAAKKLGPDDIHIQDWLIKKTKTVHGKPGQGSVFNAAIIRGLPNLVKKEMLERSDEVAKAATGSGVFKMKIPDAGYDLVVKKSPDGRWINPKTGKEVKGTVGTAQKAEGPNKIEVPSISTPTSKSEFITDEVTVIVRPMKNEAEEVIPGEYIVLSMFPGSTGASKRASEWAGEFAVVKPGVVARRPKPSPNPAADRDPLPGPDYYGSEHNPVNQAKTRARQAGEKQRRAARDLKAMMRGREDL